MKSFQITITIEYTSWVDRTEWMVTQVKVSVKMEFCLSILGLNRMQSRSKVKRIRGEENNDRADALDERQLYFCDLFQNA